MNVKFSPAVTETKVVEVKPACYTVELSQDELDLLVTLTGSVIQEGDDQSIRKLTDSMYRSFKSYSKGNNNSAKYKGYRSNNSVRFIKDC